MPTESIVTLKKEITRLEAELDRHHRALRVLEGTTPAGQPAKRPARPTPRPAAPSRKALPRKGKAGQAEQPTAKVLIQEALTARAPQLLTPGEIEQEVARRGATISRKNVHRRLSDLLKAKVLIRKEGRYGVAK